MIQFLVKFQVFRAKPGFKKKHFSGGFFYFCFPIFHKKIQFSVKSQFFRANPDFISFEFFQGLIERLDSKDWTKVCESLNNARRFALYHSSLLLPFL